MSRDKRNAEANWDARQPTNHHNEREPAIAINGRRQAQRLPNCGNAISHCGGWREKSWTALSNTLL